MAKSDRESKSFQIALLRGINVGGRNKVAMADLRKALEAMGLTDVQTLLQSGNIIFKCDRLTGSQLERWLEKETADRLDLAVDFVVRTLKEWSAIVARNPFPDEAVSDPSHLVVMCCQSKIPTEKVAALRRAIRGREKVHGDGNQLYIVYPDGIGTSKFTGAIIERTLGIRGTARNWNTVLKLLTLCEG